MASRAGARGLQRVEEGDEAAELAKLASTQAEVQRLEEEVNEVEATLADIEEQIKSWKAAFDALDDDEKEYHESARNYRKYLEKERDCLRALIQSTNNRLGGMLHMGASQVSRVTEVMHNRPRHWLVSGYITNIKRVKGMRAYLYATAADYAGLAEVPAPMGVAPDRKATLKECIKYDDQDLHFRILFHSVESGQHFANRLTEHSCITDNLTISDAVLIQGLVQTFAIRRGDYDTLDASSPAHSQVPSSQVSNAEPNDPLTKFQSIEGPHHLTVAYDNERAHLVHASEIRFRYANNKNAPREDVPNNRLVMTSAMHRMFDGRRNGEGQTLNPAILIEAVDELPETAPVIAVEKTLRYERQRRHRVWLKLTAYNDEEMDAIIPRIKPNSIVHISETTGERECFTYVHVTKPDVFIENLTWKANETKKLWQDV